MRQLQLICKNAAAALTQAAAFSFLRLPILLFLRRLVPIFQSCLVLAVLVVAVPASAHEYWIEPINYQPILGKKVLANLRNGENFEGVSFPRLPDELVSVTQSSANGQAPVAGRLGDFPAVHFTPLALGWNLATVQTQPKVLRYTEAAKFDGFIRNHGFESFIDQHPDLSDGSTVVEETYTRFAKALINVKTDEVASNAPQAPSTSSGTDNRTNSGTNVDTLEWTNNQLRFEWVVKQFPTLIEPLILQLLHNNSPLPDRHVEVYAKTKDGVKRAVFKTDEQGTLELPLVSTEEYLINAVRVERSDKGEPKIKTDWASLTVSLQQ